MELSTVEESHGLQKKGGLRSLPFIMGNEIFEKVAGIGLGLNMIRYVTIVYKMSPANGSIVIQIWGGFSNILTIFGAYLSDAYLGRFHVIIIGSISCLIGTILLWLTTILKGATPFSCSPESRYCKSYEATPPQLFLLFSAYAFMAVGSGAIRPCTLAFGADQFSKSKDKSTLKKFFSLYYACVNLSFMIGIAVIVPIQDKIGWRVGFFIPVALMVISNIVFLSGSSLYIKVVAKKSLWIELWEVLKKSFENRHVNLPAKVDDGLYLGHNVQVPSKKLRFFNKACMISNTKDNMAKAANSVIPVHDLCTVEQVENLKSVIRVLPIWSASIIVTIFMSQSFTTLQLGKLNRRVFPWFEIPPASFGIFSLIPMTLFSGGYNRFVVPIMKKITGNPLGLTQKQRIGIGIIIGTFSMAISAMVENYRRRFVIKTARWLIPQLVLLGFAEALAIIGQIEFYYSELPKSMASFGVALFSIGAGVASLLGSVLIKIIRSLSTIGGRDWLADDLDDGRYDYYYWVLAGLGVSGFVWFVICSRVYGEEGKNKYWEEEEGNSHVVINGV